MYQSKSPYSLEMFGEYPPVSLEEARQIVRASFDCYLLWEKTPLQERALSVKELGPRLEAKAEKYARIISAEMGKPVSQSIAEIKKCAALCEYYGQEGPAFLANEQRSQQATISYEALGVIVGIMPWNFPFWQVFRFAIPNLLAGNAVIVKHAENVPRCAQALQEIFKEAAFPERVFRAPFLHKDEISVLLEMPEVQGVSVTGSTAAGKAVAAKAGAELKKTLLELGGSDAYLVLEDADVELAAALCAKSRLQNNGQSCIAAKRFFVHQKIYKEFVDLMKQEFAQLRCGDPLDEQTSLGPLARLDLRQKLEDQVQRSVQKGAKKIFELELPEDLKSSQSCFFAPCILEDVAPGMPAFDEELFGPVASLISFENEADAIDLANRSAYGLGGAVFSRDIDRAFDIGAKKLNTGTVAINDFVRSDPKHPFGGIKASGYGRELSMEGIREFVNIKTIISASS